MEEESRLIKLMANFPACDLREAYFQRWKEIFSEAIEYYQELTALRDWKAKARPFLVNEFRNVNNSFLYAQSRGESFRDLTEIHETLTELLGGSDERND